MLEPRYTVGDIVEYKFEGDVMAKTETVVKGPYRDGIWWEYEMDNGDMIRDHEIIRVLT